MSPETLQIAVIVSAAAVIAIVLLLGLLLTSRIRTAAQESMNVALTQATQQHEQRIGEFTRQFDRAIAEFAREHQRSMGEATRQHERALAELAAEHKRIAQEFSMFSQKRHEVYARLYARYRRATHDLAGALTGNEPDFQKFSRDELLRYLKHRNVRERDAADAIAAMDRGDIFAMSKLMARLHWRISLRDATAAFERAREYEALNELYLSDAVRDAVGNVRRQVEVLSSALMREQDRADLAKRVARQDDLHSAVASLLVAMRDDLRTGTDGRPKPRVEIERTSPRAALPPRTSLADKAMSARS